MISKEDIGKKKDIICSVSKINKSYLKVKSAKFECPSCGSILSVLQLDEKFRQPKRCGCGRRGGFKVISKELIEAQDIVIMEKETNFEYKAYIEGQEVIDKLKNMQDTNFVTIKGEISDEYKKNSTKGEFVIFVESIEQKKEEKPAFLR
jgi:DNA replicative helicase MCM subunit Mcm2 (Cdc46/Mcm family)